MLKNMISDYSKTPKEHIILSSGSDLLIREMIHLFSKRRKTIVVDPTFFPITQAAKQFAPKLLKIRLSEPSFDLPISYLIDELNEQSLIVIDNPNNPTGNILLNRRMIEDILETNTYLLIDEAYYEFSRISFADIIKDHPNLAITRTMDKAFSLAGARIGYLIAGKTFLNDFSGFDTFLPLPSVYAAIEALKNIDYMKKNVNKIIDERKRVRKEVAKMGIEVYPSNTNFHLMRTGIPDVARELKNAGVLVFDLSNLLSSEFIRVSIGTKDENNFFLFSLGKLIKTYNQNSFK
jgi:histidinol-phosphate aminotransferase